MAIFIGLMSGTSMDAIDAALVELEGNKTRLINYLEVPFPSDLQQALATFRTVNARVSLNTFSQLHVRLGKLFAEAALQVLKQAAIRRDEVTAIGSHGQTIYHQPHPPFPCSVQIGDPNTIAQATGITTVADFRGMDIAAGGQGAPLTPAFHQAHFHNPSIDRVVLNIGGIANITVLPADAIKPVLGFDVGPGNALLDDWARLHLGTPMDEDGRWSKKGRPHQDVLRNMLRDPFFHASAPKSTGREYFNLDWLSSVLGQTDSHLSPEDIQATLVSLTCRAIRIATTKYASSAGELLVCGGGAHNPVLMQELAASLPEVKIAATSESGLPPSSVEAVAFAWLAMQRITGKPGNLPSVTGAERAVVLGAVYQPAVR
ncbi:MAG: anhydro-N-acetylmuramic acid kinase [Gammaproteobacteria bacterium]